MARPKSEKTRKAVTAAALELLAEQGYLKTTIEAIAARAGAGKQTVYRRWGSKANLYLAIYEELAQPAALDMDLGDTRRDLETLLVTLFGIYRETGIHRAVTGLVAEQPHDPEFASRLQDHFLLRRRSLVARIILRGLKRGELRPGTDPNFISDLISGAVWFRILLDHEPLDADFATTLVDHVLTGVEQ